MRFQNRSTRIAALAASLAGIILAAPTTRYTLILEDPPAVRLSSAAHVARIQQAQQMVRARLESRGVRILGSVDTLLNAVFVVASPERLAELESLPGVKGVIPARTLRPLLNKATAVVNAPAAWNTLGGKENAGKGVKIGIIDSGIDQNHAAFRNTMLPMPPGFPKCDTPSDCTHFTNNKVIVARSFVSYEAAGTDPKNPAADSRPDDLSPRDRLGHGTAVASCAAGETVTGLVTFNGIAPGAWLGNYKVFGTASVNYSATDQTVMAAVEQALKDDMDVINMSLGDLALTGPLDTGPDCGRPAGVPCDVLAAAVEAAVHQGLVVVISAGNQNGSGTVYPTYNTIGTPGDAPSVITVGASTDAHLLSAVIRVAGLPQEITAIPGTTWISVKPFVAPLVDAAAVAKDAQACTPLPPGSLYGSIALVKDSGCDHFTQAENVVAAGGVGMILYAPGSNNVYYAPSTSQIPAFKISNADYLALTKLLGSNRVAIATITAVEQTNVPDQMLHFSSIGPSTGDAALKPDLAAPGGGSWGFHHYPGIYMATQSYDAWSDMWNPDGFAAVQGTSFSAPIVAGAAALVKQAHPAFTPAQIKSALVNTAAQTITTDDAMPAAGHAPFTADAQWFGAGRLDLGAAVASNVTIAVTDSASDTRFLSSFSFGVPKSLPLSKQLTITNNGAKSVNLTLAVTSAHGGLAPSLSSTSIPVNAGQSVPVTVKLDGSLPAPGEYSGAVTITGAGVPLHVPYLYIVSDGAAASMIKAQPGDYSECTIGSRMNLYAKVLDRFGAPVTGLPVHWINDSTKGTLGSDYSNTDKNGIATMIAALDQNAGDHPTWAAVGDDLSLYYGLPARAQPTINGVINGASFDPKQPVAPGSYITITGTDLSDLTGPVTQSRLPVGMGDAFVSFDVPPAISVPGHFVYTSPGQINLQMPWELKGQKSVQVKVSVGNIYGNVVNVPAADYSPAFFEIGGGMVAALDSKYVLITSSHPVGRGQVAQLYANGLGPVTNQPASGDPALANPLSEIPATSVKVSIAGKPAEVQWAGLSPNYPALYQVNVVVPSGIPAGHQPITVSVGGKTSKASIIPVQ